MGQIAEKLAAGDGIAAADVSIETQLAVERFLYRQAEILDEKQWDDWLTLFTEDAHYWMPAEEDQTDGEGVPNIFWENLDLMRMRIGRNNHPRHTVRLLKIVFATLYQMLLWKVRMKMEM